MCDPTKNIMIIKKELGEKGQVVILKDIREFLDLKKIESIVFEVKDNQVLLKKERDSKEFLKDFLNIPKIKRGKKTVKEMIIEKYEK